MTTHLSVSPYDAALAGLLRCAEPPVPLPLRDFVAGAGAELAWEAIRHRAAPPEVMGVVAPRLAEQTAPELESAALLDLARADAAGARIMGPEHPDWPAECWQALDWTRAYDDCPHASAPLALYCRGLPLSGGPERCVSIVGSRAATPYGARVAGEMAAGAAEAGRAVVSGAAFGIDAAAHRSALHVASGSNAGLPREHCGNGETAVTIAVLSCGIDRAYPAAHRGLIDAVTVNGTVVTEYPPGFTPMRHRFLVRNRLIAALSGATVVVEAGRRSGSLNTATTAANLGRQVCAVPGPVTSALSLGCHDLIRDGRAGLVTGWADIEPLIEPLAPAPPVHRPGTRTADGLDLVTSRVHDALPRRGEVSVDDVVHDVALPAPDVLGALAVLHTTGLARRKDGLWSRATPAAARHP